LGGSDYFRRGYGWYRRLSAVAESDPSGAVFAELEVRQLGCGYQDRAASLVTQLEHPVGVNEGGTQKCDDLVSGLGGLDHQFPVGVLDTDLDLHVALFLSRCAPGEVVPTSASTSLTRVPTLDASRSL
jgi:hypothetical protein